MTSLRFAGLRSFDRATLAQLARDDRAASPALARRARDAGCERVVLERIGQIHAARIQSRRAVQHARQRNARMRLLRQRVHFGDRIADDVGDGRLLIDDAIDERRVGAVLQQAAHQVRQQVFVRADRRIHAARQAELVRADDLRIQLLAHAMQALEFERALGLRGELHDRRDGLRVVRRELRIDARACADQLARAGDVRHVGVDLAREHRIAGEPALLRALDLAVPVRALHEPHVQPRIGRAGEVAQPANDFTRALLIRLHRQAETVPALELRRAHDVLDQLQRQLQPLRFFGVDRERDAAVARRDRELVQARRELGQHASPLRELIAREQRRQLDRNARRRLDRGARLDRARHAADRLVIRREIALGVRVGQRGLAEHVERVAIRAVLARDRALQRFLDRAAHDELVAHDAHGLPERGAQHRLAEAARDARDHAARIVHVRVARPHDLPGEHQAPGRGVDEQRFGLAEMRAPVARGDLVGDQLVGGRVVGDAQQRLGQAHQDHAFLRGQVVLAQEGVEPGALHARSAHAFDQLRGTRRNALACCVGQTRRVGQLAHDLLFVAEIVAIDGGGDGSLGCSDGGSRLIHGCSSYGMTRSMDAGRARKRTQVGAPILRRGPRRLDFPSRSSIVGAFQPLPS